MYINSEFSVKKHRYELNQVASASIMVIMELGREKTIRSMHIARCAFFSVPTAELVVPEELL